MHKTNISLFALALTLVIALLMGLVPPFAESDAVGIAYFPAILLSLIFSNASHSLSAAPVWSGFVAYTLMLWALLLAIYAILWEWYLLRRAFGHLKIDDVIRGVEENNTDYKTLLRRFGEAVFEAETRRRRHWLLANSTSLDLSLPKEQLAIQAINTDASEPTGRALRRRYLNKLKGKLDSEKVKNADDGLKSEIRRSMQEYSGTFDVDSKGSYYQCDLTDTDFGGAPKIIEAEIKHIEKWRGKTPQCGLALSGGGIRSASFNLGVLQALAKEGCLEKIDYLSTVSGGGYIGASLTYLLHQSNQSDADNNELPTFDVSASNFPYLSYPMVDISTSGDREASYKKGRLLRRLRQNAKYLTPGKGITLLSLIGVVMRNSMASLLVHSSVLLLLLQILVSSRILPTQPDGPNGMWILTGCLLGLYLLVSLIYGVSTGVIDNLAVPSAGITYRIRRYFEQGTHWLFLFAISAAILGLLPQIYFAPIWSHAPDWMTIRIVREGNSNLVPSPFFSALVTALGAIGNVFGYLKSHAGKKTTLPVGLVVAVASALLLFGILLLVFHVAVLLNAGESDVSGALILVLTSVLLFTFGWMSDVNYMSVHRYYRDRLMETFLPDVGAVTDIRNRTEATGKSDPGNTAMLWQMCGVDPSSPSQSKKIPGPYHIINTNIVLTASANSRYRGRGGDCFILSPLFSGSRATGWKVTNRSPNAGLTLATAMAASGAALNPNAGVGGEGVTRQPILSVLMGLFNIRMGYWHVNPNPDCASLASRLARLQSGPNLISPGLFESLGRNNLREDSHYVLLTDGGHFENLGLYELVRRRLKLIVVGDAGADPKSEFEDLANAIEKVRADFGTLIEICSEDLEALVPHRSIADLSVQATQSVAQHGYLVARIKYAASEDHSTQSGSVSDSINRNIGWLIYLKATYSAGLTADLSGYRKAHPIFPNQPTTDQFFDEKQFEAYRELGFQTAFQMLNDIRGALPGTIPKHVGEIVFPPGNRSATT